MGKKLLPETSENHILTRLSARGYSTEICRRESFKISNRGLLTQCYWCENSAKNEMGGTCSTYGGRGEMYIGFWWGKPEGK